MKGQKRACFLCPLFAVWGHSKKLAVCSLKEGSYTTQLCWHPHLRLLASRTVRTKFLFFISHLVYGILLYQPKLRKGEVINILVFVGQLPKSAIVSWNNKRQWLCSKKTLFRKTSCRQDLAQEPLFSKPFSKPWLPYSAIIKSWAVLFMSCH